MANPIGEDSWVALAEEATRGARDLEQRVHVVEVFKRAVGAEPGSLKVWMAYCEYFWSLYSDCQDPAAGWPEEEQLMGREIFSLDAALALWHKGYEEVMYRLSDSHQLWDRWISLEMELLAKTKTAEGIKRITHLYRNRLQVPHMTWDTTSQHFSNFLSEYNHATWEETMQDVTARAQAAKKLMAEREDFELKLAKAERGGDEAAYKAALSDYMEWEIVQSKRNTDDQERATALCEGLFARALTGVFAKEDSAWCDYAVYLSTARSHDPTELVMLDVLKRAVHHCPWSGTLWSRFILAAEEAGLAFSEVETIKHTATSNDALYNDGMTSLLDMYVAWCGFLKRTAMAPNASDDAVDIADVGMAAALEDVAVVGNRKYGKGYKGDPNFRIERIYIQYLTEKKGAIEEAREMWDHLAGKQIHADSYDFWLNWYMWEMMVFATNEKERSPTPSGAAKVHKVPAMATSVLSRAVHRKTLDWPERVLEIYLQHCNDYEKPETVRRAVDTTHKARKGVARRREREAAQSAAAYAVQAEAQAHEQQQEQQAPEDENMAEDSPSGAKRKRDTSPGPQAEGVTKRPRNETNGKHASAPQADQAKRDRENTTVIVRYLPEDVTQTKVRQYFTEYGHVNNITLVPAKDSATALIEFRSPEEAQSALLRDGKYFQSAQISATPGTDLTLFVTNYPPTADDKYLRSLFKDCGEILSIRWPSLKFNTHRRFVYVTFADRAASAKATQLDGTVLEGRFKLVAKYSDPSNKKSRDGAVAEGRELVVKGLGLDATEDELQDIFGKYGEVDRVRILRNQGGRSKGVGFVVFETREDATKAATELDKTKFKSQILSVEISKATSFKPVSKSGAAGSPDPSSAASPAPSYDGLSQADTPGQEDGPTTSADKKPTREEIAARTIAIMGLPDTVNDTRVRALVAQAGPVVKLILQPRHAGAIIEYADAATAGRAALQLDGAEIDGRKLRTGTVAELQHERDEKRIDRVDVPKAAPAAKGPAPKTSGAPKGLMAPPPVRRPALGKAGNKRGLGFVVPKAAAKEKTEGSAADADDMPRPMRSNADFKAMFLGGGTASNGTKGGENGSAH